jgi:NAD(P)-dependent dehydrogenase (short-subunit alcohol dehydrogenase family)
MDLKDKVALVTGASRGVGAATAVALAEAGCDVACAARSTAEHPQKTPGVIDDTVGRVRAAGRDALAVPTNLAVGDEVERMVRTTHEHFGRLDILINNAAISFVGDLDVTLKRHDLMMEVNLRAPFIAIREAAEIMKAQGNGAIINVSSLAALHPFPDQLSYGMGKIALERLTVDAAKHLQQYGIAVNCFRIDIAVASEGFLANTPTADHSGWEPPSVAAEGILWMLQQPVEYSGRRESMYHLREREGIMQSQLEQPYAGPPTPQELYNGLAPLEHYSIFEGMYKE